MRYLWLVLLLFGSAVRAATLPASTQYAVDLTWSAPTSSSDPVAAYAVYREQLNGSFAEITTGIAGTSYTDNTLPLYGVTFMYYATSVDAEGNQSVPSNTVSVVIPFVPYAPVVGTIQGL